MWQRSARNGTSCSITELHCSKIFLIYCEFASQAKSDRFKTFVVSKMSARSWDWRIFTVTSFWACARTGELDEEKSSFRSGFFSAQNYRRLKLLARSQLCYVHMLWTNQFTGILIFRIWWLEWSCTKEEWSLCHRSSLFEEFQLVSGQYGRIHKEE
jgi:hypothetical protein